MRGAEKLTLLVLVAVPLLAATLGWPMFLNWVAGPPPPAAPTAVPGAPATQAAAARVAQPTPRPTIGAPATVQANAYGVAARTAPTLAPTPDQVDSPSATYDETPPEAMTSEVGASAAISLPAATPEPAASDAARPASGVAPQPTVAQPAPAAAAVFSSGDPREAVSNFYSLVSSHQFDSAASLWSPHMRAAFPPETNLTQRFSQTNAIRLQRVDLISQNQSQATVAVDLLESDGAAGQRHYVGNWYLVRGSNGWMLDQPQLQAAP